MQDFGLLGTWSTDCTSPGAIRETYDYNIPDKPAVRVFVPNRSVVAEVTSAARAAEDKIEMVVEVRDPVGKTVDLYPWVFEKVGAKVRRGDFVFEKCLN